MPGSHIWWRKEVCRGEEIHKQTNSPLYSHPQKEDIFVIGSLCLVMVILSPASAAGRTGFEMV